MLPSAIPSRSGSPAPKRIQLSTACQEPRASCAYSSCTATGSGVGFVMKYRTSRTTFDANCGSEGPHRAVGVVREVIGERALGLRRRRVLRVLGERERRADRMELEVEAGHGHRVARPHPRPSA